MSAVTVSSAEPGRAGGSAATAPPAPRLNVPQLRAGPQGGKSPPPRTASPTARCTPVTPPSHLPAAAVDD